MKKQTLITDCTFAAMTMATPAVFAVQPALSNPVSYTPLDVYKRQVCLVVTSSPCFTEADDKLQ